MTVPASDGPFLWNVAGRLGEPPGSERDYPIQHTSIDLGEDLRLAEPIDGRVRLSRTNRGILARADLHAALALECSRCLREIAVPIAVEVQEEYLPSIDLATGHPLPVDDEPDVLRLSDHHELDLETPVREAIQLAEPIAPLCRPECPGLCVVCGGRLEEGVHDHPDDDVDPRLEALRGFRPEDD
ncbi:MAG: DUF177 domain-containing protein [Chloroflexi bacterium]|nr:DUF177 domain-containing protein [Chloroflexota bacterium]